jgi:hypothetical protein
MPLEIKLAPDAREVSLQEYVEALDAENYDFSSRDDVIDSAKWLKRLANNRNFLLNALYTELKSTTEFQKNNYYGPQVFLLHSTKSYLLRAVIWRPLSALQKNMSGFRYDILHDHNFDILTIGYAGPGYTTRNYSYDKSRVVGLLGEDTHMIKKDPFTLSEGTIALYRAKHDIHIQLPPPALSVSLNLIPRTATENEIQYQIDEDSGRIIRYIQASGTELVVRLAGILGEQSFLKPLSVVARDHPSLYLRALAIASIGQITGVTSPEVLNDEPLLIQDIVTKEWYEYGTCLNLYTNK